MTNIIFLKGTKTPLRREDIFANDGSVKATDLCKIDPTTGLAIPNPGTEMLLANGHVMSIRTDDHFVHPQTGEFLRIYVLVKKTKRFSNFYTVFALLIYVFLKLNI